jgi:hypothetical protein
VRQEIKNEERRVRSGRSAAAPAVCLEPEEQEVLKALTPGKPAGRRQIEADLSGMKKGVTMRCLKGLVAKGLVRTIGRGPNVRYERLR